MRQRRTHRAAGRLDDRLVLPALEIAARDRPVGQVIFGPGMAALGRIIEIAAIGRRDRAHGIHLRVPIVGRSCLGDLDAAAAVAVIHEQLERQDRMDRARDIDIAAVGRPGGRGIDGERLVLRQLPKAGAIDIGDPEIGDARPVGEEGELLAIGREDRIALERHAGQQRPRRAPAGVQRIDVAQQVEQDRLAVRRHVGLHPGRLMRVIAQRPGGRQTQPLLILRQRGMGTKQGRTQQQGGKRTHCGLSVRS